MPNKISHHGGKRSGAGRKPILSDEKKVTVSFYPKKIIVETLGNEEVKTIALIAVENAYKKYLKKS